MNVIEKQVLLDRLQKRLFKLKYRMSRDLTGSKESDLAAYNELKFWYKQISDGHFDIKVWSDES